MGYDVIVAGGGHAGCEAALASARIGASTLLVTVSRSSIAKMSCNPAIGGLAKGQIVREIDALGGEMARAIDATGIQFRMLNTRKGPAVQSLRAQADRELYGRYMIDVVSAQPGLTVLEGIVEEVIAGTVKGEHCVNGVVLKDGTVFHSPVVILTTGTFLKGLIHVGMIHFPAGRAGDPPVEGVSCSLSGLGFEIGRMKTGTPPRIAGDSIDFDKTVLQPGDDPPPFFSYSTDPAAHINRPQEPCYLTYTNPETHNIIKDGLDRSPLYSGIIKGVGPRYCPSIEDKVVRFPDRDKHRIFLEPETTPDEHGGIARIYYPNGISTSLPVDCQVALARTVPGLENARLVQPGYAIEYDYLPPTQLYPTLETKLVRGLFNAGQINGTSGYEEAAAQGLVAGINGCLLAIGQPDEQLVLKRSDAYIGVMIDDLVTKGTDEPYRMFTSRAEYRLLLRHDNADVRLMGIGNRISRSLVSDEQVALMHDKTGRVNAGAAYLVRKKQASVFESGSVVRAGSLFPASFGIDEEILAQIKIEMKYAGYIKRDLSRIARFEELENKKIPPEFVYPDGVGLSAEVLEKLTKIKPVSLGQASRISGITPAAISLLMVLLEQKRQEKR